MKTIPAMVLWFVTAVALTVQAQTPSPEGTRLSIPNSVLAVDVLVKSPAEAPADLQVVCLFRSVPDNKLLASLAVLNQRLGGLLDSVRSEDLFRGDLGETLLINPKPHAIAARRLLLVGLGERNTYTVDREEMVGAIVYTESQRLHITNLSFAPTVLDGGGPPVSTGDISAHFLKGFLRARSTNATLHAKGAAPLPHPLRLTYLAGPAHALDTRDGLVSALSTKAAPSPPAP